MRFTHFHYRGRFSLQPSHRVEMSAGKLIDADWRARPDPAAVAGQWNVIGVDRVEGAVRTANRRREARHQRGLLLEHPLKGGVDATAKLRILLADHDDADPLLAKAIHGRRGL